MRFKHGRFARSHEGGLPGNVMCHIVDDGEGISGLAAITEFSVRQKRV